MATGYDSCSIFTENTEKYGKCFMEGDDLDYQKNPQIIAICGLNALVY